MSMPMLHVYVHAWKMHTDTNTDTHMDADTDMDMDTDLDKDMVIWYGQWHGNFAKVCTAMKL